MLTTLWCWLFFCFLKLTLYPPVIFNPLYCEVVSFPCVSFITLLSSKLLALASKIHFVVGSVHSNVKAFVTINSPDDKSTSPDVILMTLPFTASLLAARTEDGETVKVADTTKFVQATAAAAGA